jgi:hypothetical protein
MRAGLIFLIFPYPLKRGKGKDIKIKSACARTLLAAFLRSGQGFACAERGEGETSFLTNATESDQRTITTIPVERAQRH